MNELSRSSHIVSDGGGPTGPSLESNALSKAGFDGMANSLHRLVSSQSGNSSNDSSIMLYDDSSSASESPSAMGVQRPSSQKSIETDNAMAAASEMNKRQKQDTVNSNGVLPESEDAGEDFNSKGINVERAYVELKFLYKIPEEDIAKASISLLFDAMTAASQNQLQQADSRSPNHCINYDSICRQVISKVLRLYRKKSANSIASSSSSSLAAASPRVNSLESMRQSGEDEMRPGLATKARSSSGNATPRSNPPLTDDNPLPGSNSDSSNESNRSLSEFG